MDCGLLKLFAVFSTRNGFICIIAMQRLLILFFRSLPSNQEEQEMYHVTEIYVTKALL